MKVIKLGGSLMDDTAILTLCLNTIEQKSKEHIVIVPGGGMFADQVRSVQKQWGFDDNIAHHMAILAMQQMALLYKSIAQSFFLAENISAIQKALVNHATIIWSPDIRELNSSHVKPSWDVTSDSLSAWLANQLMAEELILVKSAEIPLELSIQDMQIQGLLDMAFNEFTKNSSYKITLINKHRFNEYAFT
ncbi:MAG: uridylate kinase [Methylococcaceae bacterium]|nr:uridylate kinase [Methylococcaceae bacterium]